MSTAEVETLQDSVDTSDVEQVPSDQPAVEESGAGAETDSSSEQTEAVAESPLFSDFEKYEFQRSMLERAKAAREAAGQPAKPEPKADPTPEPELDVKLPADLFDDPKQAEAIEAVVRKAVAHTATETKALRAKVAEQEAQLRQANDYIQQTRNSDPNVVYDSLRKEFAEAYPDVFSVPAVQLRTKPDVLQRAASLIDGIKEMADMEEVKTGIRPRLDDPKLARKVLAMCDDIDGHPLQNLFTRSKRAKLKAAVNGKAEGATTKGSARTESSKAETAEQRDARLIAYADRMLSKPNKA